MSASTHSAAKCTSGRPAREALERWLAEADALLAGISEPPTVTALPRS